MTDLRLGRIIIVAIAIALSLLFVEFSKDDQAQAHTITKSQCKKSANRQLKELPRKLRTVGAWRAIYRGCRKKARQHAWTHRVPSIMVRIRACESGHNYQAQNPTSTASGGYQYLDTTWGGHEGYARAKDAPRWVQDRKATLDYYRGGTTPWAASRHCWG